MIRLPEHLQGLSGEDLKEALIVERKKLNEERKKQTIHMIIRQTDYSYEEAEKKLKEFNNNALQVVKDFMGIEIKEKKKDESKTVNQRIYGEIRTVMDESSRNYRMQKERQQQIEAYNKKIMILKAQHEEAQRKAQREAQKQKEKENKLLQIKEEDEE